MPPPAAAADAEFLQAADEVLADMSKLLSLPVVEPLKKSVRSRDEIRDYLVKSMKEDKKDDKRDADRKTLEALGLIPRGYPLDQKLLSLLTEQIAGMYDPKSREFFIADWTSVADQRMIMAHELTHALQDQHFHVEKWQDAAKPNDDAELARSAVLEGSATVAMLDYLLRDTGKSSLDISDLDPSLLPRFFAMKCSSRIFRAPLLFSTF
jgi:predicted transcriptional regulator